MALRDELLIQAIKASFPGKYEEAQEEAEKLFPLLQQGTATLPTGVYWYKNGTSFQASTGSFKSNVTLGTFAINASRDKKQALTLAIALSKTETRATVLVPPETFSSEKAKRIGAQEFGSRHERKLRAIAPKPVS